MQNNDILRRLRYALDLNDATMTAIFKLADYEITRDELLNFLKKDEQEGFVELNHQTMALFLEGLITHKRGKLARPTVQPEPVTFLSNNDVLKKIRVALEFKEDDMLNTLKLADFNLSKSELSAFFRKKGQKNYRDCGDQVLRNFLQGLAILRTGVKDPAALN
jgi:uncharacterized protein YehS (DUF1456 family)